MNEIDKMLHLLETRSWIFSPNFLKRALAVFGHVLFVQILIGIGWAALMVFLSLVAAVLGGL